MGIAGWSYPRIAALLLALALVPLPLHAQQATAEDAFEAGVEAFREGDYSRALDHFQNARRAGLDTPALHYNLGATHYRLEQHERARREFEQLLRFERWAPLAHYNLGLIAERQGRDEEAMRHFRTAERESADPKLRNLAARALAQAEAPPRKRWSALVSLAGGFDSNVTLSDEPELVGVTDQDDVFLELLGAARGYVTGDRSDGVRLDGALYVKEYPDIDRFDEIALRFGASKDRHWRGWSTGAGGIIDVIFLDDEHFQNVFTFNLEGSRPVGPGWTLDLRNRLSRIQADDDFEELEGWRNQIDIRLHVPIEAARVSAGYQYEFNDRDDLSLGDEFFSRSPHRHTFSLQARRPFAPDWELTGRAEYRRSDYRDADRIETDGGDFIERTREEDRFDFLVRADWRRLRPWVVFGEYRYTNNDSNFGEFDYTRNVVRVGVQRVF